jgi:PAS domain S-box-containing protein
MDSEFEERFRLISEAIEDVFWISDRAAKRIIYVSPAYERIWGRSVEALYANPGSYFDTLHPDDRHTTYFSGDDTKPFESEYRIVRPDGAVRLIRDRGYPVVREGAVVYHVGIATDITETRTLERQLRQAQKMEAIGQLAGGVAHDFNNVLQAAILELALLQKQPLPPPALIRTTELRAIIERAANLTRQLLVFSRREAMSPQRVDINSRVVDVVRLLRRVIGESIALNLELASGILPASADPSMLDQVLMNLAVNARDAMPDGGILTIETSLCTRNGRRHVCISVRDTGIGIPADDLPRIFEPFFTTKEPGRGTGLGLATVHGIVEQHGGSIDVTSKLDHGTTFTIYLPALDSTDVEVPVALLGAVSHGSETILVVEDDRPVRIALRSVLECAGYRIVEADRGVAALAAWDEHAGKIDLVLTDVVMPGGMSGGELAERIEARNPRVPIIFVTGYNPDIVRTTTHQLIKKPIDPDRLLQIVRETLDYSLMQPSSVLAGA